MSYRRHDSYVPVESAWMHEVPTSWKYSPLWPHFRVVEDRAGYRADTLELLSVSQTRGVLPRSIISDKEPRADDLSNYRHCRAGDVVINRMSAYQGAVGVSSQEGMVSPDYLVIRCSDVLRPHFLVHMLKSAGVIGEIVLRLRGIGSPGTGTVRTPRIGASELGRISIPLPSVEEQDEILIALDRETAQIDDLITKQECLIELLGEKRQAIITHAVTKGLDPGAPTSPSGIPWLGDISGDFQPIQLGRLVTKIADGPHFSPHYVDEGVPFLSARNVRVDGWSLDDVKFISDEDYAEFSRRIVPENGDILYTKGGTTGVARVVDLPQPFQIWVHIAVLKVNREQVNPYYLAYALNSHGGYDQSQLHTRGATNKDLGLTRMTSIWVALPSLSAQQEIVDWLDSKVGHMDLLIARSRQAIDLLVERRGALVSAAITGKMDIRARQTGVSSFNRLPLAQLVES